MKVGFANGCFDLFHEGHRHFLTQCRAHCDYLVVAINSDRYCRDLKGADRPYHPLQLRMTHVRSLAEAVFPFEGQEASLIMQIRPDVIIKGSDHSPHETHQVVRNIGWKEGYGVKAIPVFHVERLPGISTSIVAAELAKSAVKG